MYDGGEAAEDSDKKEEEEMHEFKWYLGTEPMFEIVSKNWGKFCLLVSGIYCYHLLWCIAGVNVYADYTRLNDCNGTMTSDYATSVFDVAIAMSVMYHMIEWVRWTLLLTTALVEANLLKIFNVLQINIPFGVIACLVAIITRYSGEGTACAAVGIQETRAFYCGLQVVALILMIPFSFAHIVFMKIKGVKWCHEEYIRDPDEEEEEPEKKEGAKD